MRVRAESAPGGSPGRLRVRSRGLPGQPLGARVLIDTTITHPLRADCVGNAAGCPAYAANKAAEGKITKYGNQLQPGDTLLPAALETYGTVSADFARWLRALATAVVTDAGSAAGSRVDKKMISKQLLRWRRGLAVVLFECIGSNLVGAQDKRWGRERTADPGRVREASG